MSRKHLLVIHTKFHNNKINSINQTYTQARLLDPIQIQNNILKAICMKECIHYQNKVQEKEEEKIQLEIMILILHS